MLSCDRRRMLSNGLATALIGVRGTFSVPLTSRCRRRRSWCSQPFLFPGGTATAVDLARTTEKSFRGRSFRRRHLLFNHSAHLTLAQFVRQSIQNGFPDTGAGKAATQTLPLQVHLAGLAQVRGGDMLGIALMAAMRLVRAQGSADARVEVDAIVSDPSATTSAGTIRLLVSLATYNEAGNLQPAGGNASASSRPRARSWSSTTTRPTAPGGLPTSSENRCRTFT